MSFLFDVGIPGETGLVIFGVGFFFIVLAAAFVVFRLFKKSLKLAIRVVIFFVIVAVAFVGCSSLFYLGTGNFSRKPVRPTQTPARQR